MGRLRGTLKIGGILHNKARALRSLKNYSVQLIAVRALSLKNWRGLAKVMGGC